MKIKDTKLVLQVKSFKAGKYIQLLLSDSLEDFQKSVAPLIPRMIKNLRNNDGHETRKYLEKYIKSLETMLSLANQVLTLVDENVVPNMNTEEDESGRNLTVDGNLKYKINPGDGVDFSTGKSTTKKKAKKAKKEE